MLTRKQKMLRRKINTWATKDNRFENAIATPYELCNEILDKIDVKGKSILVLFSLEFAISLIQEYDVDPVNITVYGTSTFKGEVCKHLGVNYVTDTPNTKFDVVIGNPPYNEQGTAKNEKLWAKFVKLALLFNAEYIALITPNGMISAKAINGKKSRALIEAANYGFIDARDHIENPFKDFGVDTCHFILKHNSKDLINPIINSDIIEVPQIANDIISKVISYEPKLKLTMGNGDITRKDTREDGSNLIYFSGSTVSFTSKSVQGAGELKVVFPFSSSYHKMFVTKEAIGMLNMSIDVDTHNEAEQIMSFANSKLFNLVAKYWNKTSGFCPFVKRNMVPDLRRATNWTDEELYTHFGLTEEEIEYVKD